MADMENLEWTNMIPNGADISYEGEDCKTTETFPCGFYLKIHPHTNLPIHMHTNASMAREAMTEPAK